MFPDPKNTDSILTCAKFTELYKEITELCKEITKLYKRLLSYTKRLLKSSPVTKACSRAVLRVLMKDGVLHSELQCFCSNAIHRSCDLSCDIT